MEDADNATQTDYSTVVTALTSAFLSISLCLSASISLAAEVHKSSIASLPSPLLDPEPIPDPVRAEDATSPLVVLGRGALPIFFQASALITFMSSPSPVS